MKITVIYGQSHEGSTYHIARMLAEKINGEITEFFLPKDFGEFCTGCTACFMKSEKLCPHFKKLQPITTSLDEADIIILASPVYVYHATGPMKALLDHYGYRWMVHRPEERMFYKQAVCISTAAGGGTKQANNDMADSLSFWGITQIYKLGINVRSTSWEGISEQLKEKIEKKTSLLATKINKNSVHMGFKIKGMFYLMRFLHKKGWSKADLDYWEAKGWSGKVRPWKTKGRIYNEGSNRKNIKKL